MLLISWYLVMGLIIWRLVNPLHDPSKEARQASNALLEANNLALAALTPNPTTYKE